MLNRAGLSWGWFEGGFRPTESYQDALAAIGQTGQSTATFIPDEFANAGFQKNVPHSSNQGLCDAVHPVGVALGGTGQCGYKDDYIPHHEPFQFYASTANPHHLTIPTNSNGQDTLAGLREIGCDTQSYVNGVPQFNTPNHQYDTSDFDQLVAAIANGQLPASALPVGHVPEGAGLRGRPRRLLGPDRRAGVRHSHHRRTDAVTGLEAAPRCSSTGMTPTAGTTTSTVALPTRRSRRPTT